MMRTWALVATVLAPMSAPLAAADLRVGVEGVANDDGAIMVALHRPVDGVEFPDVAGAISGQWRYAITGSMRFVFPDLAPGDYAVAVFHDEDGDGELERNLIGIPIEGYGFSEEAQGSFGPPTFDQAAISIVGDAGAVETRVRLSY